MSYSHAVAWSFVALIASSCTTTDGGAAFPFTSVDAADASDFDAAYPDAADSGGPSDGDDTMPAESDAGDSGESADETGSDAAIDPPADTPPADSDDGDVSADASGDAVAVDAATDTAVDTDVVVHDRARRIVVAGDSWSAGVVFPIIDELAERGLDDIVVSYATTAIGGTRADQWATNAGGLRDALVAALDADPPADVLWLSIGGNDFLGSAADGLGGWPSGVQTAILDGIRDDVRTILETATHGRPELTVVIAGYDYLQFLLIEAVLGDVPSMDMTEFNGLMIELERRKLDLAVSMPAVEYAHNIGLLQHVYGEGGLYAPGAAPMPGGAPSYSPFPGGFPILPSPAASYSLDGIHPTGDGYRVIVDNIFDQGLQRLLEVDRWEVP